MAPISTPREFIRTESARDIFKHTFEDTRKWYGFYIAGYLVMPERVHLLLTEAAAGQTVARTQMLKQNVARRLRDREGVPFWRHGPARVREGHDVQGSRKNSALSAQF